MPSPGAPTDDPKQPTDSAHAEAIRTRYLKHEGAIRGLGTLLAIGNLLALAVLLTISVGMWTDPMLDLIYKLVMLAALLWVSVGSWGAIDMRRMLPRAKVTGTLACAQALALHPLGFLITFYGLYLLHSDAGNRVLQTQYREIRLQTTHIQPRVPLLIWITGAVCLLTVVAYVIIGMHMGPVR